MIEIDKYLGWYKGLTQEIASYNLQKRSYERTKSVTSYLKKRWGGENIIGAFISGLGPGNREISWKFWVHFDNVLQQQKKDLEDHEVIIGRSPNFIYYYTSSHYLPNMKEWEDLDYFRKKQMESTERMFTAILRRSIISDKERMKKEFDDTIEYIRQSPFYENVIAGHPIAKDIIDSEANKAKGKGWDSFITWIYSIDLSNWLTDKINNIENDSVILKNEIPLLKWEAPVNTLYTLFFDLLQNKIITWNVKTNEGDKMEIARMLSNYFVNKDGERLSVEMIKQTLKPGTAKAKKKIEIRDFVLSVNKNQKKDKE